MANNGEFIKWETEGKTILTDKEEIAVRFIKDIPEAEFDAHLEMVLAAYLAWECAYAITGSTARESAMGQKFMAKLEEARTVDAQENTHKITYTNQLNHNR